MTAASPQPAEPLRKATGLFRPSPRVLGAYEELSPPADGWEDRVELFQLLPLLVHVVLFGGSYGAAARRVLARYV